jgi:hypothetical protein
VRPTYEECSIEGENAVVVSTGKCHYRFTSSTEVTTTILEEQKHARVRITCPQGESITMTSVTGCKIRISNEENPVGRAKSARRRPMAWSTQTSTQRLKPNQKEIAAHVTVKDAQYTSNFKCQLTGIPATGTAEFQGTATVQAFKWESGTTEGSNYVEGEQVGIERF